MPITLDKLFSTTVASTFEYLGEVVHITWAPSRYTGEMDDLAESMTAEETQDRADIAEMEAAGDADGVLRIRSQIARRDRRTVRTFLSALLVSWDVMDGRKPYPTDEVSLAKLPDDFLQTAFMSLYGENAMDPQKAPSSNGPSEPKESSEPQPRGSRSSGEPTTSASPRGT